MKRLMVSLVAMLVSFAFGVGIDRLIWHRFQVNASQEDTLRPVPLAVVETKVRDTPVNPPVSAQTAGAPKPPIIFNYSRKAAAIEGAYYWIGPQPKEFEEFQTLELLSTSTPVGQPRGYMGWIYALANDDHSSHPASFGLITDKRVFIITSQTSESNFEYRLEGEFVRKDFEAVDGKNKAVIRGTLTKYRDGKKVAETDVSFRFEYMGC